MIEACGMSRSEAGLKAALARIPELREQFFREVAVPSASSDVNIALGTRRSSGGLSGICRSHVPRRTWRETNLAVPTFGSSTKPMKARLCETTSDFCNVSAWQFAGTGNKPILANGTA